jgi:hypothetical protein
MEKVIVNISWSGNNYCAGAEINGVVFCTNKTLNGVKSEFVDMFKFHIDGSIADGDILSEDLVCGDYEFDFKMEISALLHSLDGIVTRSAIARVTGINERQLGHYASGIRNPRPEQRKKIIMGIHHLGNDLSAIV